jgi:hypothetical protein
MAELLGLGFPGKSAIRGCRREQGLFILIADQRRCNVPKIAEKL